MDSSPPGSSVHGILQTRTLEQVANSFSRRSSQPRDWTRLNWFSYTARRFFNIWLRGNLHPWPLVKRTQPCVIQPMAWFLQRYWSDLNMTSNFLEASKEKKVICSSEKAVIFSFYLVGKICRCEDKNFKGRMGESAQQRSWQEVKMGKNKDLYDIHEELNHTSPETWSIFGWSSYRSQKISLIVKASLHFLSLMQQSQLCGFMPYIWINIETPLISTTNF